MYCTNCGSQLIAGGACASCGAYSGPTPQPLYYAPPVQQTNGMAIAALVVSIVGCGFNFLGLVFGLIALNQIKQSGGRQGGQGLAIAGVVIGGLCVLGFVFLLAMPSFWYGFSQGLYGY